MLRQANAFSSSMIYETQPRRGDMNNQPTLSRVNTTQRKIHPDDIYPNCIGACAGSGFLPSGPLLFSGNLGHALQLQRG